MSPSRVLGLRGKWLRWMFDDAVATFGRIVQNRVDERDNKGRQIWTVEDVLSGLAFRKRGGISDLFAASGANVMDF